MSDDKPLEGVSEAKPPHLVTDAGEHTAPPRNVVRLPVITTLDVDPDVVLLGAMGQLECVVVVGYTKGEDGVEFFASSVADAGTAAWLLQRGIWKLNKIVEEKDE